MQPNRQESLIYGIDILKGSAQSGSKPLYSLCVMNIETGEIKEFSGLRLFKILQMAEKDNPKAIVVDNIFELAPDKSRLIEVMKQFPDNMQLIQVTGSDDSLKQSLPELARKYGISMSPDSSADEARTCAQLADMGVGTIVSLFEDKTRIKVSRARSPGKGGWSQNRYARKIHGAVREKAREIESKLSNFSKETGVEFESRHAEGFGGFVHAEFVVYDKKSNIPVRSGTFGDSRVSVSSVARDKIHFIPLHKKSRELTIVGIDPGTTIGIAIFSLNGDLLFKGSFRGLSSTDAVRKISLYGKPLIIASDVYPVPSTVEKIKRSFQAVSKTPDHEVSSSEKIELARPYNYVNDHERDALAAGLLAYKSYKPLFSKIESKTPAGIKPDNIKERVVRGESVETAIENLSRKSGASETDSISSKNEEVEKLLIEIKKIHEELRATNDELSYQKQLFSEKEKELLLSQKTIKSLESRIHKIQTDNYNENRKLKEIQIRDLEIKSLKKELKSKNQEIDSLRKQRKKARSIRKRELRGDGIPVKVIDSFTRESISVVLNKYGISENEIVYIDDPSGGGSGTAEVLSETNIRGIIASSVLSHKAVDVFFDKGILILDPDNLNLEKDEDFAIVSPSLLEKEIEVAEERLKTRRHEKDEEKLQNMLDEYRSERRRGLI
ncbi:MAG: DUF460 domain-containing protein [Methanosarcinaceae archaeon]|nr:DUF460 domain-containing protein [Methanosarcinaceae archaeon]